MEVVRVDSLLSKLEDILLREINLYQKILELSKEKTNVITAGDTVGLDRITRIEQGLILQGGALERELDQCIQQIMLLKEEFSAYLTLSLLIQHLPEPHKQKLTSIGNELIGLLQEQKEINALNSSLIQNNLDYIYNILSKMQGAGQLYTVGGTRVNRDMESSILDKKV
jgi:hypothetical protein